MIRVKLWKVFIYATVVISFGLANVSSAFSDDWQTYRNEEWGFESKHPKNWSESLTRDNLKGGAVVGVTFINPQQISGIRNGVAFVENRPGGRQAVDFFVQRGINPKGLSILEWSKEQIERFKKSRPTINPTSFAGRQAVISIYPGKSAGSTFVRLNKTDILSFSLAQETPDAARDEIYNRILSSVKLTNGESE